MQTFPKNHLADAYKCLSLLDIIAYLTQVHSFVQSHGEFVSPIRAVF